MKIKHVRHNVENVENIENVENVEICIETPHSIGQLILKYPLLFFLEDFEISEYKCCKCNELEIQKGIASYHWAIEHGITKENAKCMISSNEDSTIYVKGNVSIWKKWNKNYGFLNSELENC